MRQITPIAQFDWKNEYAVSDLDGVLTPALLIYPEIVEANIRRTIELLEGQPQRWRPHVKTAKLASTMRALVGNGVDSFKCATTLELRVACEAGARDVLVAYPLVSANARRVRELAEQFPRVRVSVLVEDEIHVQQWTGSSLGIFVDINPGMDRTGIAQNNTGEILKIIAAISEAGLEFRGIHYYDGHLGALDFAERRRVAHAGYDQLIQIVSEIEGKGFEVEVITAGTPCFPCSLDYAGFASSAFRHRVSPGTIVYCDATSLAQLPPEYGYRPAAVVLTRVVSHPTPGIITCDAGHKSVSADAGVPTCVVMGHTELTPQAPSEEHLPMAVASGSTHPAIGDFLYLVPRHVCPTVNNFDQAILTSRGRIKTLVEVTARGHEAPLLESPQLHQS